MKKVPSLRLADIPADYRPIPFWSWNDKLDPEELRRQIREMHRAGIGGFFMHARGGLQTAYLSEEWMECVNASLDEAGKLGMNGWLYDENGWPSGFGGGLVNGLGPRYQQKYLRWETGDAKELAKRENTIAFYTPDGLALLGKICPKGAKGEVLRCYYELNSYYVDNLDPEVVKEFLRVTHQHYYDTIPKKLLKHMKGIFTDEPQLSRSGFLWSLILEDEYRKAYGRELLEELPMLFLGLEGCRGMRIRFWNLASKLFNLNFMKQIRDWCDAHGWQLTGHHVLEETCHGQTNSNGSVMTQYRYYHVPGMDHLGRSKPSPVTMTQLISAADQIGQKQVLTESFAMTGWNFNFSGIRWMANQQFAHGVNLFCQHLEGYTLRGLRKRDYPASFFIQQPWWPEYRMVNDYLARTGMLLAEGKSEVEVLVAHPLSSAWVHYQVKDLRDAMKFYTESLKSLTLALDSLLVPHHYADEALVEELGSAAKGELRIGKAAYRLVILPALTNLSATFYKLLRAFEAKGGVILKVRNRFEPGVFTLDGDAIPDEAREWFETLPAFDSEQAAAEAAADRVESRIIVTEHGVPTTEIAGTWRDFDDLDGRAGRLHLITNTCYNQSAAVTVALPRTGRQVEVLDPATGEFSLLRGVRRAGERLVFDYPLSAGEGALFFVSAHPAKGIRRIQPVDVFALPPVKRLDAGFTCRRATENLLTLDRCRFRVDGGEWEFNDVNVIQPRLLQLKRSCELELEFTFDLAADFAFDEPLFAVAETPERFQFALNGHAFEAKDAGEQFDAAFRRIELPKALKRGRNTLTLRGLYTQPDEVYRKLEKAKQFETEYNTLTYDSEIESIYLAGRFSCRHRGWAEALLREADRLHGEFELGAPIEGARLDAGRLIHAGLPFFAGRLTLEKEFELTAEEAERVEYLRFAPLGANSYRIRINGTEAGFLPWGPYAVPAAGLVRAGKNHLEIELVTSLRNLLGPHHLEEGESYGVSTRSFDREANAIGNPPQPYNEGYCVVRLGLSDLTLS